MTSTKKLDKRLAWVSTASAVLMLIAAMRGASWAAAYFAALAALDSWELVWRGSKSQS